MTALRLAFTWLTVLPVGERGNVDRTLAGRAIGLVPLVGVVLGVIAAGIAHYLPTTDELAALVAVAALALLTRGMHLDGLADTCDGLGCYGPPERAREVMRSGGAGPFGVAAIVFVIAAQTFAFAAISWQAIVVAVVAGRVGVVIACRSGTDATPDGRFGVLVAGTQPIWLGAGWLLALATASVCIGDEIWVGPLAVITGVAVAVGVAAHCVRRFGGLSGDVLGATVEFTTTLCAVVAALGTSSAPG